MHDPGRWLAAQLASLAIGRVIDVGCGEGRQLRPGDTGIDVDPARVRSARERSRLVAVADAHRLPFRDSTFRTALAIRMLNDAGRIDDVLTEIRRVLTADGRLLVYTRARRSEGDRLDPQNGEVRLRTHFADVRALADEEQPGGVLFVGYR
jgi:ubiquinone/menaquinone biosynthesis C-methylase UbiE